MRLPKPLSPYVLQPPDGKTVEGWLSEYDSRPSILPRWPTSQRMTLVAVVKIDGDDSSTVGYVLTHRELATTVLVADPSVVHSRILFFSVTRQRVIPFCPTLTPESWPAEERD